MNGMGVMFQEVYASIKTSVFNGQMTVKFVHELSILVFC